MSAEYAPYGSELYVNPTTLFNSTIPIQTLSKNLPKNFNVCAMLQCIQGATLSYFISINLKNLTDSNNNNCV